jgi:hypothetical protein
MAGQLRLRIRYRQYRGPWFDYLLASAAEVHTIVAKLAGPSTVLWNRKGRDTWQYRKS